MGSAKEYHDRRGVSVPLWLVLCILGGGALVLFMPTGPATHANVREKEPSNLEQLRLELDREIASLGSQSVVDTSKANAASTLLAALPKKKYKLPLKIISSNIPVVSLATAHPAKFTEAIIAAGVDCEVDVPEHVSNIFELDEKYEILPNDLNEIQSQINRFFSNKDIV